MPLTTELDRPSSPIRRFIDTRLPDLGARANDIRSLYHNQKPGDSLHPSAPGGSKPDYGMLGTAIEHRLNWSLTTDLPEKAIKLGTLIAARTAASMQPTGRQARLVHDGIMRSGRELLHEAPHILSRHQTADHGKNILRPPRAEDQLGRLAVVTAWLTGAYHSNGRSITPATTLGLYRPEQTLDDLFAAVPTYAVEDLTKQIQLTGRSRGGMRSFKGLRHDARPGHTHVGVQYQTKHFLADPDVIADGTLLDIKSTTRPERLDTLELRQLAAYALLDTADRYHINRVGLYRTRSGYLFEMPLPDFLRAAGAQQDIAGLRADLRHNL